MYEDLLDYTKNLKSEIAIEYFGNKITYEQLRKNIETTAASFIKLGVEKGDVVSVCTPYLPETIYTIEPKVASSFLPNLATHLRARGVNKSMGISEKS